MEVFFNTRKVKFDELHALVYPITASRNIKSVNIFINIDDMLHTLHRPLIESAISVNNSNNVVRLTSNILNLAAHYRGWAQREGFMVNVYLVYSSLVTGSFRNNIYNGKYRDSYKNKFSEINQDFSHLNHAIHDSLPLMQSITQYIEGVYAIDSHQLEPSIIPYYIATQLHQADWNFVVSKDRYDFQYATMENWAVIYPGMDIARVIYQNNIWKQNAEIEKIDITEMRLIYDTEYYVTALSIVGNPYRGIPRIRRCGWKTLYKIFDKIFRDSNNTKNSSILHMTIAKEMKAKDQDYETMNNNLDSTDVSLQCNNISSIDIEMLTQQIVDIPDSENLVTLDRAYFSKYPLSSFLTTKLSSQMSKNYKFYHKK